MLSRRPMNVSRRKSTARHPSAARSPSRLELEHLETRLVPANLLVMNTNDAGPGSLRVAMTLAVGGDTIDFNIPAPVGTIAVGTRTGAPLPPLAASVTIDGYSEGV